MEIEKPTMETVSKPTHFQRYFSFRNVLIGIIIAFSVLTFFAKQIPYFPFDLKITLAIQNIDNPVVDFVMKFLTQLGNFGPIMISMFLVTILLLLFKKFEEAAIVLISSVGVTFLAGLLKVYVHRPRPDPELVLQIYQYKDFSFPSGHVLFAIGFYGIILFLAYSELKKGVIRNLIMSVCLVIIILMSVSRIYLGAHWFSDTLGSYLIGTVWLYLMILLYKNYFFFYKKVEKK